jgi:hypothetical protein
MCFYVSPRPLLALWLVWLINSSNSRDWGLLLFVSGVSCSLAVEQRDEGQPLLPACYL